MSDPGPSTPRQIPCLTPEQATYGHFRSEHLLPNTPCLFPASYTRDWPIRRYIAAEGGSIDYEALEQRFGSLKVSCAECGGVESAEVLSKSAEPPIDNFLDLLRLWQSGRGRSKYLKDWHLPLAIHHGGARNPDGDKRSVIRKGKERVRDELYEVPPVWLDDWMNEYEGSERDDDFRFVVRLLSVCPAIPRTFFGLTTRRFLQYAGGGDTFTPLHRDVCELSRWARVHHGVCTLTLPSKQTGPTRSAPNSLVASDGTSFRPIARPPCDLYSKQPSAKTRASTATPGPTRARPSFASAAWSSSNRKSANPSSCGSARPVLCTYLYMG